MKVYEIHLYKNCGEHLMCEMVRYRAEARILFLNQI